MLSIVSAKLICRSFLRRRVEALVGLDRLQGVDNGPHAIAVCSGVVPGRGRMGGNRVVDELRVVHPLVVLRLIVAGQGLDHFGARIYLGAGGLVTARFGIGVGLSRICCGFHDVQMGLELLEFSAGQHVLRHRQIVTGGGLCRACLGVVHLRDRLVLVDRRHFLRLKQLFRGRDLLRLGRIGLALADELLDHLHQPRRQRRIFQHLGEHLGVLHQLVFENGQRRLDDGPVSFLLVRRGRGVVDHHVIFAQRLVADQRQRARAVRPDDPDQARVSRDAYGAYASLYGSF